ncbi:MAG: oligosaccharide flippase family protein [Pseudomonadota bacterium]
MNSESPRQHPENRNGGSGTRGSLGVRVLSGGIWMLGSRGIQATCGMLVSMLLARLLTPADLGTYFILASIALLGSTLAQFGTHHSVVKLVAGGLAQGDEAGVRRALRSVLLIVICGCAIIAGGYLAGAGRWLAVHVFRSDSVALLTGLTAVWIVLRTGQMLLSKVFRGFHDLRHAAMYEGAQTQLLTVLALLALWLALDTTTLARAVQATLAALLITLLSGAWLLWRRHWSRLAPAQGLALGPALRLSAPLFVSSAALLALGEMHLWILGARSAPDQVALYGAGYRLVLLVSLPLTLVNNVIPPMVAELFTTQRRNELERLMRTTASMIALPALLLLALLLVFAGGILTLVYGDFYRAAAPVLAILAVGQAINVWTGSPGVLLSMSDQQGMLMRASVGGGMVGLVITLALARDFGATGVAIGYAGGLALQNVAMAWIARRRLGIRTYAGPGHLRDAWYWLRGELARRAVRGGPPAAAERLLRPLENLFCALARTRIVEGFGDVGVLRLLCALNRRGCLRGVYFRATLVAPGPDTTGATLARCTGVPDRIPPDRALLFVPTAAGAVQSAAPADDELASGYLAFLKSLLARGYTMALMTLPERSAGRALAPAGCVSGGLGNDTLRQWAAHNGVYLIDLDASLAERANAPNGTAGHAAGAEEVVDYEALCLALCELLEGGGFRDWLHGANRPKGSAT